MRVQQTGRGLGSDIVLTLLAPNTNSTDEHFQVLWAHITKFEAQFSRFKTDSELTHFNHQAGKQTAISPEFKKLLTAASLASIETNDLYNPLLLPALQQAGYIGSWPTTNSFDADLDYSKRKVHRASEISIYETSAHIPADAALDFGGIGKGYLLDQLADYLDSEKVTNYWLSLGGDIVVRGFDNDEHPWKVGVASALDHETPISFITNKNGARLAIATSGTTKRKGETWHHIIDPRTGRPSTSTIISVTTTHISATEADVWAKSLLIAGESAIKQLIDSHHPLTALAQSVVGEELKIIDYGDIHA
jgi:thiamine biosynthesis lipoprotein